MRENPRSDRTLLVEVLPDTIRCTVRAGDRLTRIRAMVAVLALLNLADDQAELLRNASMRLTSAQINADVASDALETLLDKLEKDTK